MAKIFISYSRKNRDTMQKVVDELADVFSAEGIFYDTHNTGGRPWWDNILEQIREASVFVYLVSNESLASYACRAEYMEAMRLGKHIVPVDITDDVDLAYTDPPLAFILGKVHRLKHRRMNAVIRVVAEGLKESNAAYYREKIQNFDMADVAGEHVNIGGTATYNITYVVQGDAAPIQEPAAGSAPAPAPKPKPAPRPRPAANPNAALTQAADAMEAEQYAEAVAVIEGALEKNPSGYIERMLRGMLAECETALAAQRQREAAASEYASIREMVGRESTRQWGCEAFADFRQDYPDYDPDDISALCAEIAKIAAPTKSDILPPPFAWIDIPTGKVTLITKNGWAENYIPEGQSQTFDVPAFAIAKYPLTNAQFAPFIEAGGYKTKKWWTDAGWGQREKDGWTEPRFWSDSKWNGTEQPVVGVSWYEAIAYCQWLSEQTGQKILLPTEQQWQFAAQGDEGRDYPWGSGWNRDLCNNNVDKKGIGKTTPVTQYEGKGDSPFGVVDMAGNVWEWCLTEHESGSNGIN